MAKRTLPPGRYVQIYRGAVRGNGKAEKRASIAAALDRFKALGIKGVIWHGSSTELTPVVFLELAALATARGLLSLAAFGDGDSDPEGFGRRVGAIANLPECVAVVLDMEGVWENEANDKADAVKLGRALREVAPDALVFDQPWPVPNLHSSFPWDETAAFVDVRAPQWYFNDFKKNFGGQRYQKCLKWFGDSWRVLETKLGAKNLIRPRIMTIQGYGWDDIFPDLVDCLTKNPTIFIWSEPYPTEQFMKALEVVKKLEVLGFAGSDAVLSYQRSTNGALQQDNRCGPATLASLGLN